ncbi:MAG: RelA/SpoT family protein [Bacteroidales bacterium]|nr:RelA/SpoT family protein [Bacteroidales bacterium]
MKNTNIITNETPIIHISNTEKELKAKLIRNDFENFIKKCRRCRDEKDQKMLWEAFNIANLEFEGIKKNSQEFYIEHSVAVAKIVINEIGLGVKSAISALLHDIVDETDFQIDDIEQNFGAKTASILKGLSKVREVLDSQNVVQAEAFRKILLTLSDDIRVIFIKIADRLHHMRTLSAYSEKKKLKTVTESLYVYVPLAHRLGLYNIKTELEDLSLKFKHPEIYQEINSKISGSEKERTQFITNFSLPIISELDAQGIQFDIDGRTKSIYSIWSKMQKKHVSFDEVYDLFAIRIVFNPSSPEKEIEECWRIYSLIAKMYHPKVDRIRDWITSPKPNGYEALHVTVLGPKDRWVEVQIRSKRMNDLAEIGFAAHWKYKGISDKETDLDIWIKEIKDKLGDSSDSSQDFFDSFNLNIFASEVLVFTPSGEIVTLPKDSTVLDFAFEIHTDLAFNCIGAKIGRNVVPLNHVLSSGDIVEILSSTSQKPSEQWFHFVTTTKARKALNKVFNSEKIHHIETGRKIFKYLVAKNNILVDGKVLKNLLKHFSLSTKKELYLQIGNEAIAQNELVAVLKEKATDRLIKYWKLQFSDADILENIKKLNPALEVDEMKLHAYVEIAKCCNPQPGDDITGCQMVDGRISLHRADCEILNSGSGHTCQRVVRAQWTPKELMSQLYRIELSGSDRPGIANQVTTLISTELNVNIKALHFDTHSDIFYGMIDIYIANEEIIKDLAGRLQRLKGIDAVKTFKDFKDTSLNGKLVK